MLVSQRDHDAISAVSEVLPRMSSFGSPRSVEYITRTPAREWECYEYDQYSVRYSDGKTETYSRREMWETLWDILGDVWRFGGTDPRFAAKALVRHAETTLRTSRRPFPRGGSRMSIGDAIRVMEYLCQRHPTGH